MRSIELLGEHPDDLGARGVSEAMEFAKVILERFPRASPFEWGTDQEGAFSRILNRNQVA